MNAKFAKRKGENIHWDIERQAAHTEALRRIRLAQKSDACEMSLADLALERLPKELGDLTALTTLRVDGCLELTDISVLRRCPRLTVLDLRACPRVIDLSPLQRLHALRELYLGVRDMDMEGFKKQRSAVTDINDLSDLTSLKIVTFAVCDKVSSFKPLATLSGLQHLALSWCKQLQDLQPLAGLAGLQHLDLSWCKQLQDLQPLAGLAGLQHLDLSRCKQLQDLQPLAGLAGLQHLDLSGCEQLQDLQPLAGLAGLQHLALSGCEQLQDLQPLAGLTALQHLYLRVCEQLQDLQPLAGLTALQHLYLSGCEQLQDLQPLAGLTALQHLDLNGCEQLQDVQPLAGLTALQHLDLSGCEQLQDVQPLAGLTALQYLDLSRCEQLRDLQPLAGLTTLQHLHLIECQQLQDLRPLAALTGLKEFNLFDASVLDCSSEAQPLASWSELEMLSANRLTAAPSELGSSSFYDNALPRLHGWQEDLVAGEAPNSTVKLFVLGNGRVGKTQICRRLCGEGFDPSTPSTHGISLGQVQLAGASGGQPAVDAHFWDFGGQDIYLGTHALFLDERAIYVIAWTPQYENTEEFEKDSVLMRNRPLAYWLDYLRSLVGVQAPVIVVQSQCDRELDVRPALMPTKHEFDRLRVTSSSAKQDDGMERLQLELKSAARYLLERYGKVRLPAIWVAVGEALRARSSEKTVSRAAFDELCRAKHGAAVPGVVLEYLHRSGQVFWHEGVFDNQVVLDLAWALCGVYAVLERKTALPEIRRRAGHFSPQLLGELVWKNYVEAERQLFLSLMEQCQICFKVTEDVFIAPALLPAQDAMEKDIQRVWRGAAPEAIVCLDYAFLHEGVLRAILCGIGTQAGGDAVYWAYGVCFYDSEYKSTLRIGSDLPDVTNGEVAGCIRLEAAGTGATPLAAHLVESIQHLNIGHPPQVTWELGQADHDARATGAPPNTSEPPFAVKPTQPPRLAGEAQLVYVSYAWGGESEALVDEFERRLPENFKLIRDKNEMLQGDRISRFMMDIGRADRVLVVLSEKYLRSVYCMHELLHLFNTSLGEREAFMRKVIPLRVDDVPISRAIDRTDHIEYWQQQYEKLDAKLAGLNHASVGEADRAELLAINDFQHRVSDMLAWVADTLMPQGTELQTKGIDAAIDLLQQRASVPGRSGHHGFDDSQNPIPAKT